MEKDVEVDDIVNMFLLNTTRLRPRLTQHAATPAIHCGITATQHPSDDEEAHLIPLTTGSVAGLYIEPMHECFGDTDVMFHYNTELAIPRGHSPPTQLPDEFHKLCLCIRDYRQSVSWLCVLKVALLTDTVQ